jgi:hypothetical protein
MRVLITLLSPSTQNNHVALSSGACAEGSYLSIWAKRLSSVFGERLLRVPLHLKGYCAQAEYMQRAPYCNYFLGVFSRRACAEGSVAVCQTAHAQKDPKLPRGSDQVAAMLPRTTTQ